MKQPRCPSGGCTCRRWVRAQARNSNCCTRHAQAAWDLSAQQMMTCVKLCFSSVCIACILLPIPQRSCRNGPQAVLRPLTLLHVLHCAHVHAHRPRQTATRSWPISSKTAPVAAHAHLAGVVQQAGAASRAAAALRGEHQSHHSVHKKLLRSKPAPAAAATGPSPPTLVHLACWPPVLRVARLSRHLVRSRSVPSAGWQGTVGGSARRLTGGCTRRSVRSWHRRHSESRGREEWLRLCSHAYRPRLLLCLNQVV